MRQQRLRATVVSTCLIAGVLIGADPAGAYVRPGVTERVSVPTAGRESPGGAQNYSSVSDDGRFVAFSSRRNDLVADDLNGLEDVFVRDRHLGTTVRVSVSGDGTEGILPDLPETSLLGGYLPSLSGNGRFVAFISTSQLEDADKDILSDIYVHDLQKGTTERISSPTAGLTLEQRLLVGATSPSISRTGRYVVFESGQSDLVADDPPGSNVFLHDRRTHTTEYICCAPSDTDEGLLPDPLPEPSSLLASDASTSNPAVTPDGRYVAFQTTVDGVVPEDVNGLSDVYVFDRDTDKVRWVSESSAVSFDRSEGAFIRLGGRSISADGRSVVFHTSRKGYVPTVTTAPLAQDLYLRDLRTGDAERLSVTSAGSEHMWGGAVGTISGNGRFVAFQTRSALSERDRPPPPGINGGVDVYVHDRATGATELTSVSSGGDVADDCGDGLQSSILPTLSHTGRYVSFTSCAGNLDSGDDNGLNDVFVRDRGEILGVGSFKEGAKPGDEDPPDDRICVSPEICIPPGTSASALARSIDLRVPLVHDPALGDRTTTIRVVHRPATSDLYLRVDHASRDYLWGSEAARDVFGGVRLAIGRETYVVGYVGSPNGSFVLFRCSETCRYERMIQGGYGTTGRAATMSIPLGLVGLTDGGEIDRIEALGASQVLDLFGGTIVGLRD